ncbi:MAG TPA: slipin family protein [Candidatus Wallbacteria bacterium]|nr:MAG: FtsH protease regulator HflK [bacterium ADurb.Bin243]HPG57685.1 slipin family protein [Candidatus Wallbacteria bacterium]
MEAKEAKQAANEVIYDFSKLFAKPAGAHVSLGAPIRRVLFWIPALAYAGYVIMHSLWIDPLFMVESLIGLIIYGVIINTVRVAAQWERGIVLRLGKFCAIKGPGLIFVAPVVDYVQFVDTRIQALNIPRQKVITRDNVPAEIDGVLFFLVMDVERAIVKIQDFKFAISQYAQAVLRDVVGGLSLDDLLVEREQIQQQIAKIVEERISDWGIHVDSIRLLDIDLPEDLKKMMSRQASAEREKRATITKAEGDKLAASSLVDAAAMMLKSPGAMHLRTLQTMDGLGSGNSNTVVFFPTELSEAIKQIGPVINQK